VNNFETFLKEIESIKSREEAYEKIGNHEFAQNLTRMFAIDDEISIKIESRISKEMMRAFVYYLPLSTQLLRKMILRAGNNKEIISLYKSSVLESLVMMFDGLGEGEIDQKTIDELQTFQKKIEEFVLQKAQKEHELRKLTVEHDKLEVEVTELEKFVIEKEQKIQVFKKQKKEYGEVEAQLVYYKEQEEAFAKKMVELFETHFDFPPK
jgi:hypothetical protein